METTKMLTIWFLALGLLVFPAKLASAAPMGTAFTYQGQLYDEGYPAKGRYDFAFKLYDANSDGNKVGRGGYIELQEITDSLYLDPNEVYYVPYPPLLIHGEIDVVIPSDTTIIIAEDPNSDAIWVYGGANVQFGKPTSATREPNDAYQSELVNPPVWIIGESGNPFFNNFSGILIDRTAGTRCRLDNIYLNGFKYGILIDQQLDFAISNIYIYGCYNGIVSFGHNTIMNSYVDYFGTWSQQWQYYGRAYNFLPHSMDETIYFERVNFYIRNCLANDGDYGFTAYGMPEPSQTPSFRSEDCVAANCLSGFNAWNGYLIYKVISPGLYNNVQDKNFPEIPFTAPVYEINNPFVLDPNGYRIFLNPDSDFVDNGSLSSSRWKTRVDLSSYIEWTTRIDGKLDEGVGDIWPHYPIKKAKFSADLDSNHIVDINDLAEFANCWLITDPVLPVSADLNRDGTVNLIDFSVFANQWQETEMCIEVFNVDTLQVMDLNNVSGHVGIVLKNVPSIPFWRVSIYIDNVYAGEHIAEWYIDIYNLDKQRLLGLQSDTFSNGWHTIQLVSTDIFHKEVYHKPINVYFNNLLHKVLADGQFHLNEDYHFSGFYDGSNYLEAKLIDLTTDLELWSDIYSGEHINIVIPGSAFGTSQFCKLVITDTGMAETASMEEAGIAMAESSSDFLERRLTKKFKQQECPANVKMVIVLPDKVMLSENCFVSSIYPRSEPAILACMKACDKRGVAWLSLCGHDVTKENLTFLYKKSSVKFIYWCGHGASHIDGVARTHTRGWEEGDPNTWDEIGVFSRISASLPPLPGDSGERGLSLWHIRMDVPSSGPLMHESVKKKIVFIDTCESAYFDDMADAYGVLGIHAYATRDQIYIGWRQDISTSGWNEERQAYLKITEAIKMFWDRMGEADTVRDAFWYVFMRVDPPTRLAMWGDNGMFEWRDPDGDDNIFAWANGVIFPVRLE